MELTDDNNIRRFRSLISPRVLWARLPLKEQGIQRVAASRRALQRILSGKSNRLMVIVGPCSVHDTKAVLEYAEKLRVLQDSVCDKLFIVMRAYVEGPCTRLGWKGMIYDPRLDNSYDIKAGLHQARTLFLALTAIGLPVATEFLDPIVPQYLADLVSWAAIGARTTESQIHRQMASGLSMPIGFKNGTDGDLSGVVDAIRAAGNPHSFLGMDREGRVIIAETNGNPYGHLVMREGSRGSNYGAEHIAYADTLLRKNGIKTRLLIDCSHANCSRDHILQQGACKDVVEQIKRGNHRIAGVMLKSFLQEGRQSFNKPGELAYGISITDACIGWEETQALLHHIAEANDRVSS